MTPYEEPRLEDRVPAHRARFVARTAAAAAVGGGAALGLGQALGEAAAIRLEPLAVLALLAVAGWPLRGRPAAVVAFLVLAATTSPRSALALPGVFARLPLALAWVLAAEGLARRLARAPWPRELGPWRPTALTLCRGLGAFAAVTWLLGVPAVWRLVPGGALLGLAAPGLFPALLFPDRRRTVFGGRELESVRFDCPRCATGNDWPRGATADCTACGLSVRVDWRAAEEPVRWKASPSSRGSVAARCPGCGAARQLPNGDGACEGCGCVTRVEWTAHSDLPAERPPGA